MLGGTETLTAIANHWLAKFESALPDGDLGSLFHADSYWRDLLALTWRIDTFRGTDELKNYSRKAKPHGVRTDPDRTAPRYVTRAGTKAIEAIFRFETADGRGSGVLRLTPDANDGDSLKAWTLLTALDEITGLEERVGKLRPKGYAYSREFGGPNWMDLRNSAAEYLDRDPTVLVVGGGQGGLSIAARLAQLQVDALIVDREKRIGDNWRNRYHALTLHNQVHVNHLPYMPFPPNWPVYIPKIPTLENFRGRVLHTSQYRDGKEWRGKHALVIGTGNSAHDIAQDLYSSGVHVTLVQRGSSLIVNVEPSAQLPYALYEEGPPLEDCDLITTSMPLPLARRTHQLLTEQAKKLDQPLLDALERKGFKLDFGEDGTGWQFKYLTRGGGYYFNVGCSDLIAEGKIGLAQFSDIAEFTARGARLRNGETLPADLVILATGWKGQSDLVRKLLGDEIADRVGPIWGFGDSLELRNMFTRTPQPGLWFIAGSFAQCRIYSKYLGLQIKAS